jgi:hypothetical protein
MLISPLHAQTPEFPVEKHAVHVPGEAGLQGARQVPAKHCSPSAHCPLLHAWQVVGAEVPGRHTLALPVDSPAHMLPVPQAVFAQVLQKPPRPMPAQHGRQKERALEAFSRVHTLQDLQINETVQGSPGSPRGTQVPPVQL